MKKVKILHCADLHLGAELTSIGIKSRKRKIENLLTFDKIISTCSKEQVELLLIAGDLLDSFKIKEQDSKHIKNSFSKIPSTIVAIAPGNHDALFKGSCYFDEDWPGNVIIFKEKLEYRELPELHTRIWGAGFSSVYQPEPLLEGIKVPEDDFINICVLHGDLVSPGGKSNYNPITKDRIAGSLMDYIALGHIHQRTDILKEKDTFYAYPGNPEGQGFDEQGDKGVLIGDIWKGGTDLEFRSISYRKYLELSVEIMNISEPIEIADTIIHELEKTFGNDFGRNLYKITLTGNVPVGLLIDLDTIKVRVEREVFFAKIKDETVSDINIEELMGEYSLRGIFVRKIQQKIMDCEKSGDEIMKEKYKKAMEVGLKAFYSEVLYHED